MHRYSRKWRVQKQVMLEKLGAETNTLEIPEMVELYGITKSNEAALNEIQHRAERAFKAGTSHVETLNRLSDSLTAFVKIMKDTSSDKVDVSGVIFEFSALVKKAASLQQELSKVIDTTLNQSLKAFVKEDIKMAKDAKKKYDGARVAYQTTLNELNALQSKDKTNFKKLGEVEARKDAAEEHFKVVSNEALGVLSETHKLTDVRSLQNVSFCWKAFQTFFEGGFQLAQLSKAGMERSASLIPVVQKDYDGMKQTRAASGRPVLSTGLKQRSTIIFGVPLEEIVEREGTEVPKFVTYTIAWIWKHCRRTEGLFRISPMAESLRSFKAIIDKGSEPPFLPTDPHVACGILKQFLRDLPTPLMTDHLYPLFLEASKSTTDAPLSDRIAALTAVLEQLPPRNRATLAVLMRLLYRLSWSEAVTKMGVTNLATVVAPNILYADGVDPFLMVEAMGEANSCVTLLIQEFPSFFPEIDLFPLVRYGMLDKLRAAALSSLPEFTATDRHNNTLLHVAVTHHASNDLIAFLLEQDIPVDAVRPDDGLTPLMLAIKDHPESLRIARFLLENHASLDFQDVNGTSARMLAQKLPNNYLARLLGTDKTHPGDEPAPPPPTPTSSTATATADITLPSTWKRNTFTSSSHSPIMGTRNPIALTPRDHVTAESTEATPGPAPVTPSSPVVTEPIVASSSPLPTTTSSSTLTTTSSSSSSSSSSETPINTVVDAAPSTLTLLPSTHSEVLPISESDLDQFFTHFQIPSPLSQATALDQLIAASFNFAKECSKKLEAVTADSPVYLAVKTLGVQYQKTAGPSGLLFPVAEKVRESSESNHQSILQCGNSIPPTITKVIGGLSAYSKAKDQAAKSALAEAFQKFLEPIIILLSLFEKCTAGEVIKGQKIILETIHALITALTEESTTAETPVFKSGLETLASTVTLLTHLIRRKALNLPTDGHPQYLLFQSCATLESLFGDFLHEALAQAQAGAERDRAQNKLKALSRSIVMELTQIYAILNANYPEHVFKFSLQSTPLYQAHLVIAEDLVTDFRRSGQPELASFIPLLERITADLDPLAHTGDLNPESVVQLVESCNKLITHTISEIKSIISTTLRELEDNVLNRHFELFLDSATFHQLNLQLAASYHLALLISTTDIQSLQDQRIPPMTLPYALFYFLSSYCDFSKTLITVFTIDDVSNV